MDYLKLTFDKLSGEKLIDMVADDSCGAVSMFMGVTRDNFDGKKVVCLEYESYEAMALKSLKAICTDIRQKWPDVVNIAIYHRLGIVPTGESSIVIVINSPHRKDSLQAVAYCIDQVKATVPIWKKESYDGDASVWKENKECSWSTSRTDE